MFKITTLFLLLFSFTQVVQSQTLEGRVLDQDSNTPLEGATIVETGTTNGTSTNSNGEFSLQLISADTQLTIRYIGYQTRTIAVENISEIMLIEMTPQTYHYR